MPGWLVWLTGYLVVGVRCATPEQFLNLALAQGLYFWNVRWTGAEWLEIKVRPGDFRRLRPAARQVRARVHIRRRVGLPFWWRSVRRRPGLLLAAISVVATVYIWSCFIWTVEVIAPEGWQRLGPGDILAWAEENSLKPPVLRANLDANRLAEKLMVDRQELAWAGIRIEGTRAVIEVVERRFPDTSTYTGPAHLVAERDALVEEVKVVAGQARVKPGDTVRRGQVLIAGIILPEEVTREPGQSLSRPRLVSAKGSVWGRVWYEAVGQAPLVEEERVPTGKRVREIKINVAGREITIKSLQNIPYAGYEKEQQRWAWPAWRGFSLPLAVEINTYREVEVLRRRYDPGQALDVAKARARAYLQVQLPLQAEIQEEQVQVLPAPPGQVRVRVTWQVRQNIATVFPLK